MSKHKKQHKIYIEIKRERKKEKKREIKYLALLIECNDIEHLRGLRAETS